ncbi:MAG TPA: magnesium transporter CorA family protein [Actinomycetota bacterium]|nr:magnesium transporter CorA family protein [Actinomycetota bacterium]
MDVLWISGGEATPRPVEDVPALLARDDGFAWVDIPETDAESAKFLSEAFGFHEMALRDCQVRSHVPKLRTYPDHVFLILHAPDRGDAGHVHLLELDQFIGRNFLVTVHGPLGEGVSVDAALTETRAVRTRIEQGRFQPESAAELSHAIVSRVVLKMEAYVSSLASEIAALERRVMKTTFKNPEEILEEMFQVRHELLTIRTMAGQSRDAYMRMAKISRYLPADGAPLIDDVADQLDRVRSLCEQEKDFLQGVLEFFESRTNTKINIAMERLALIAALLLPISAVASIYGMNVIVNQSTRLAHLGVVLGIMGVVTLLMLRWTKRQGWW